MRRIVHLSDLHCPPERPTQSERLVEAVVEARPDLTVVTGDLTRRGRRREFEAARRLLDRLPGVHLVVPGNHDVPLLNLISLIKGPFGRFNEHIASTRPAVFIDNEIAVVGLNTARGIQARLNWSMGVASTRAVDEALALLRDADPKATRILVSHHPIVPDLRDALRSATRGAARALALARENGVSIVMHGHLHRARAEAFEDGGPPIIVIGGGTALSDREREEPASFNAIEIGNQSVAVKEMAFDRQAYTPQRSWTLKLNDTSPETLAASAAP